MNQKIGFIGLGIMGEPMAANLIKAGFEVNGYDIRPEQVEALSALGGSPCRSVEEVCARAEILITMLPDSPDVEALYLGPQGVLAEDCQRAFSTGSNGWPVADRAQ